MTSDDLRTIIFGSDNECWRCNIIDIKITLICGLGSLLALNLYVFCIRRLSYKVKSFKDMCVVQCGV
jgi:hypothetical protein